VVNGHFQQSTQQAMRLFLNRQNVGSNRIERAQWLGFIEVAGEADLVANLCGIPLDPRIGRVEADASRTQRLNKSHQISFIAINTVAACARSMRASGTFYHQRPASSR